MGSEPRPAATAPLVLDAATVRLAAGQLELAAGLRDPLGQRTLPLGAAGQVVEALTLMNEVLGALSRAAQLRRDTDAAARGLADGLEGFAGDGVLADERARAGLAVGGGHP